MLLKVKDISKIYSNGIQALSNVSFEVEKGELVSIIGPSGSGKSTLLRTINRMIDLSGGSILFEDRGIEKLKGREINRVRRKIANRLVSFMRLIMAYEHKTVIPIQSIACHKRWKRMLLDENMNASDCRK